MKKSTSIFIFSFLLFGCQQVNQQKNIEDLPVIDLSKNYHPKEILLQFASKLIRNEIQVTRKVVNARYLYYFIGEYTWKRRTSVLV